MVSNMKIGMISPLDPQTGISKYSEILAHELKQLGHDVDLISSTTNHFKEKKIQGKIIHLESYNPKHYDILHFQLGNSHFHEFQLHILKKSAENSKIVTTIHDTRNFGAMNIKCFNCCKLAFGEFLRSHLTYPFNWVDNYFQRFSDFFIFHSNVAMEEYNKMYGAKKPATVIPISAYRINKTKHFNFKFEEFHEDDKKFERRLVVPGYISPFKGHDILIHAVSEIKTDFKLVFLGGITDKDYGDYLKKLVKTYGLGNKIEFKGFVTDKEFMWEINNSYLILIPRLLSPWLKEKKIYKLRKALNLKYLVSQSSSAVLANAFALGKPVICSKIKVFSEFINPNIGLLCEDSVESWRNAIQTLLNTPGLIMEMSINSQKFATETLNPKIIAKNHLKVYKKCLMK